VEHLPLSPLKARAEELLPLSRSEAWVVEHVPLSPSKARLEEHHVPLSRSESMMEELLP
jgi:hypothetical protein